jgi:hypothetical protein
MISRHMRQKTLLLLFSPFPYQAQVVPESFFIDSTEVTGLQQLMVYAGDKQLLDFEVVKPGSSLM